MGEELSETENTKAVILTKADGQKIFLDLNVSTDTTAIKSFEKGAELSVASFDYATGIAVFLALCATGLAYWFGVRSFNLTKQSFDALKLQLDGQIESNKELIKSQYEIIRLDIKSKERADEINRFFKLSIDLISEQSTFIIELYLRWTEDKNNSVTLPFFSANLEVLAKSILSKQQTLLLVMSRAEKGTGKFDDLSDIFLKITWDIIECVRGGKKINDIVLTPNSKGRIIEILNNEGRIEDKLLVSYHSLEKLHGLIRDELNSHLNKLKAA